MIRRDQAPEDLTEARLSAAVQITTKLQKHTRNTKLSCDPNPNAAALSLDSTHENAETQPMKIHVAPFRVREGETVKLHHRPTRVAPVYESEAGYEALLANHVAELDRLQQRLYAADSHAVLLIFQAMDAAGKDGVIRHVMSGINPQGCQVFSFKHPSAEELQHDFLWRCTRDLPERGRIGIFNRSYYEEVLVVRVHPEILRAEGVAGAPRDLKKRWQHRYRSINDLERHLHGSGTKIVKFFLHLSKEEQRERFLARIEEPKKNWKFSVADIQERAFWDDYMTAYEDCLSATSTDHSPWYVVPADDKRNARLFVSRIVVGTLEDLKLRYPKTDAARREELETIREALAKE
jgi:PPK2 family polyphosphate:nucleotide phosphotransferase